MSHPENGLSQCKASGKAGGQLALSTVKAALFDSGSAVCYTTLRKAGMSMRNKVLDAAKAIAAYSVVLLHVRFPGKTGELINALARFAVPFFFMVSGYFCFKTREEAVLKRMPGKVKHILLLIGISFPFYILWGCIQNIIKGKNAAEWLREIAAWPHVKDFFIYNSSSAVKSHLWFLPALLYCYVIFWIIAKLKAYKPAYFLIPVLLTVHVWMDEGRFLLENSFRVMEFRNYLFTGLPFFLLGHLIHRQQEILKKRLSGFLCLLLVLLGALITITEFFMIGRMELYIGSIFMSAGIFLFAVLCPGLSVPAFLERVGENDTLYIYILHLAVNEIWEGAASAAGITAIPFYTWTKPLAVCILTTVTAAVLCRAAGAIRKFS